VTARLRDARLRADALGTALSPASLAVRASAARHRLSAAHAGLRAFVPWLLRHRQALDASRARLEALSPLATLRRGFAVAVRGGQVLTSVAGVAAGDSFLMLLQDGDVECRVVRTRRR
jgi:exodeoxyribonuclease VII large subunit